MSEHSPNLTLKTIIYWNTASFSYVTFWWFCMGFLYMKIYGGEDVEPGRLCPQWCKDRLLYFPGVSHSLHFFWFLTDLLFISFYHEHSLTCWKFHGCSLYQDFGIFFVHSTLSCMVLKINTMPTINF